MGYYVLKLIINVKLWNIKKTAPDKIRIQYLRTSFIARYPQPFILLHYKTGCNSVGFLCLRLRAPLCCLFVWLIDGCILMWGLFFKELGFTDWSLNKLMNKNCAMLNLWKRSQAYTSYYKLNIQCIIKNIIFSHYKYNYIPIL